MYNRDNGETIHQEVNLSQLGSLIVRVTEMTYKPEELREIAWATSVINLAFEDAARLTSTHWLLQAAVTEGECPELVEQLRARQQGTAEHGPDETWALPYWGLEVSAWALG
jgi:hypothetical protein